MPRQDSLRRLDSVSHLFLSSGRSKRPGAAPAAEAVIWLVVAGDEFNRAHIAAGIAGSFSGLGVRCTLIEIGRGLPNVGYYFALDPAEYLAPTLDEAASIHHTAGPWIRFAYAADLARLKPFEPWAAAPGAAHAIVTAFRLPIDGVGSSALAQVTAATACLSENSGAEGGRPPDCVVLFVDSSGGAATEETVHRFEGLYPDAVILTVARRNGGNQGGAGSGRVPFPADSQRSWGRRVPPCKGFFSDLATQCLQVLSLRRRKGASREAV